jgi:hypothetical protein
MSWSFEILEWPRRSYIKRVFLHFKQEQERESKQYILVASAQCGLHLGPESEEFFNLDPSMGCGASSNASPVVESATLLDETEPCMGNLRADYIIEQKLGQ